MTDFRPCHSTLSNNKRILRRDTVTRRCHMTRSFEYNRLYTVYLTNKTFLVTEVFFPLCLQIPPCPVVLFRLVPHFFKCCFTSTETIRTTRDGEPSTATSTFTQLRSSNALLGESFLFIVSFPVSVSHFVNGGWPGLSEFQVWILDVVVCQSTQRVKKNAYLDNLNYKRYKLILLCETCTFSTKAPFSSNIVHQQTMTGIKFDMHSFI